MWKCRALGDPAAIAVVKKEGTSMNKFVAFAGVSALAATGLANAEFVDMSVTATDNGASTTYRIFANFDAGETVLAVSGDASVAALEFSADQALIQASGPFDGLAFSDTPNLFDDGTDSWVTIGGNTGPGGNSDTSFSPAFLGGDGVGSVIQGSSFMQADNGGYFDSNPGTPETGSVVIAQFTLPIETTTATYSGTLNYSPGAGIEEAVAFSVTLVPAPGAVALLGLAGLAGTRRRRA